MAAPIGHMSIPVDAGALHSTDRQAIYEATVCSAAVRSRPHWNGRRHLTVSGPGDRLNWAYTMAMQRIKGGTPPPPPPPSPAESPMHSPPVAATATSQMHSPPNAAAATSQMPPPLDATAASSSTPAYVSIGSDAYTDEVHRDFMEFKKLKKTREQYQAGQAESKELDGGPNSSLQQDSQFGAAI